MATSYAHSAATIKTGASTTTTRTAKPDLLERFRDPKVCEIPATGKVAPDAFDELRPRPRTVLDYNISQTDTKVQRKVPTGITKLHVKQTVADYELPPPGYQFPEEPPPPPPPPPPKFINSTGGGPCWEFADDVWKRKLEKRQEAARNRLQKFVVDRKKHGDIKKLGEHAKLMKLVGPDWFQELSPNQLAAIDNLKNCIVKDVKSKSTCNTQANMAELGLVLRPNSKHIKMALKKCCECPVEFLLILYQLMNRHRTEYSLNDRLLLSAVVHLTMRETLKEMHIRIPSPPPPAKKPKTPVKKSKKKLFKSPYLIPFTFTPAPRKHTGIYKNRHIQYPESPYFSYISELKAEACEGIIGEDEVEQEQEETSKEDLKVKIRLTNRQSGITEEQEKELVGELKVAQREYNALSSGEPSSFLHKPSIYIPCDHGLKKEVKEEVKEEEEEEEEEPSSESETNATVSVEVRVTTDFDQCYQPVRKVCECKITFDEWETPKNITIEEQSAGGSENSCNGGQEEDVAQIRDESVVKEVENTDDAVKTDVSNQDNECEGAEQLVSLGQRESTECQCKEEVEKVIETNLCQCDRCKADRAAALEKQKPIYVISGQQEVQIPLNQTNDEQEKDVINDENIEEEATQVVPIIAGVKAKKTCNCLETYQARVKMYEEMKKRFDVQHNLTTLQQQYIIGGVTRSPTGDPVYMLSGVIPERECSCAKIYQEQQKEASRLANMPKILMGTQKYVISGVRETEQGNVYIVSGAAAKEDCTCMKMYKCYEKKHMSCLEAYQEYLKKIEIDTQEYMDELYSDERYEDVKPRNSTNSDEHEIDLTERSNQPSDEFGKPDANFETSNEETKDENSIPEIDDVRQYDIIKENDQEKKPPQTQDVCHCEEKIAFDTDGNLTQVYDQSANDTERKNEKNECICGLQPEYDCTVCICQKIDVSECECGDDTSSKEESIKEEEEPEPDLRRFIILNKIPSTASEQLEILKKALEVLAADGFPLAKLPESYKLPHFKLWMQLRSGKFWTQEERLPMLMESRGYWKHQNYCTARIVRVPELKISKARAAKYTWTDAKFIKKITTEKDLMYYRQLRQATIGDAREFFPSTFFYELPTPNFRDCYFAYAPAKEEECICWKPWYPHEIKDSSARKSCL